MDYTDFVIKVIDQHKKGYTVFAESEMGEHKNDPSIVLDEKDLRIFLLTIGRPRQGTRRIDSPEMSAIKSFGRNLFDLIFSGEIREAFTASIYSSMSSGKGLRIKLRLTQAPYLAELPWEFLYDGRNFPALSSFTPIVRHLDIPFPTRSLTVEPPLNILSIISSPQNVGQINTNEEYMKLSHSISPLVDAGLIRMKTLERASLSIIQRELRRSTYHVLHYIGHGGFDRATEEGVLLFEDKNGYAQNVTGFQLGTILRDHTSLRLVVLNSCEGARTSLNDPFSSVAAQLVQISIPAVVAMQFEITDQAAITFSEEFYSALVDGMPLETAVTEARKAIFASNNEIEWGTPVLFLRGNDGDIFKTKFPARKIIELARIQNLPVETSSTVEPKRHDIPATSITPGIIIFVMDSSASMAEEISGVKKVEILSRAVNSAIQRMVMRSIKGNTITPRFRIGLITYADEVFDIFNGIQAIDSVANIGIPELTPNGATDTARAFKYVLGVLEREIPNVMDGPAPLICHITDGEYTGENPSAIAKKIMSLEVAAGNVLLSHIYIHESFREHRVFDSWNWRGFTDKNQLTSTYATFLYKISSPIPDSYRSELVLRGYDLASGARLLFPGYKQDFLNIGIESSVALPVGVTPIASQLEDSLKDNSVPEQLVGPLNEAEWAILSQIVRGKTLKEIAGETNLRVSTIKNKVLDIYKKIEVLSAADATGWYEKHRYEYAVRGNINKWKFPR